MKNTTTVISFRCPIEVARQIDDARRPLNLSRGDWTRNAVLTNLLNNDQQLLIDRFDEIAVQISEVRTDLGQVERNLSTATYLVLTRRELPQADAKELVARALKKKGNQE